MPAVLERSIQTITMNIGSGLIRHDRMEDRGYLVVPMVMLTEGVHEGSNGPLFYPAEELRKVPGVWNMKPVIVYHPSMNGQAISACDPDVISNRKVGLVMNTTYIDGKLKAEAWLEEDRMAKVDDRIMGFLEAGQMMEVSTGLYTENEVIDGEWNGIPYQAIARNFRPDHLALLPDKKGACSIADGAGLLRNNEGGDLEQRLSSREVSVLNGLRLNEKSQTEVQRDLSGLIQKQHGDHAWWEEVYEDFVIYEKDGQFFKQSYVVDTQDVVRLIGLSEEVVKVVQWKFPNGKLAVNLAVKEAGMKDKEKFVQALIDNERTRWTSDDKEQLVALEDDVLEKLEPVVLNTEEKTTEETEEESKGAPDPDKSEASSERNEAPKTVEQYIDDAPSEMQDVLRSGVVAHNEKKDRLIEVITANKRNTFSEAGLKAKDLVELTALARLAQEEPKSGTSVPLYVGLADTAPTVEEPELLAMPTMNFGSNGEDKQ